MNFNDIDQIKGAGFTGFKHFRELFADISIVPPQKGVYMVINPKRTADFLPVGTGGYFKGKNPNVPIDILKDHWIDNTLVVYIGKATTLSSRLGLYARFGHGENVAHRGGRYIWQLSGSDNLVVCWKILLNDDPRKIERELIAAFKHQNSGRRPFANLID